MQQSLVDEGIWDSERVLERLNQLIATARSEHIPVVLVRDTRIEPNDLFHVTFIMARLKDRGAVDTKADAP